MTVIVTYHAVEPGPAPLCIEPSLFAEHAAVIAASGAEVLTVRELAARLRAGGLPERAITVTFDDGCASVPEHAAPALAEHGLSATVFCVAGHVGGANDWPTQAAWAPRLSLASAGALSALAHGGWEIGSHGIAHRPLAQLGEEAASHEIKESRSLLEDLIGAPVSTFAWPYGSRPVPVADALVRATYEAACGGGPGVVRSASDRVCARTRRRALSSRPRAAAAGDRRNARSPHRNTRGRCACQAARPERSRNGPASMSDVQAGDRGSGLAHGRPALLGALRRVRGSRASSAS